MTEIETERLRLRPFRAADAPTFLGWLADPVFRRHLGGAWDAERVDGMIERAARHHAEHGFGPVAVEDRVTGELIGRSGLAFHAAWPDDPEAGYQYAQDARRLAARVGIVRETLGIAAYRAGRWAEALTELRAARRLTGRDSYLPLIADSERALGRTDRALAVIAEAASAPLDRATQIELRIVESGIRRDQGLADAAVVTLQVPELTERRVRPWSARLFYAYADALLDAGREDEAQAWFGRAAAADPDGETDAGERFEELDDVVIDDLAEDSDDRPSRRRASRWAMGSV